MKYLTENLNDWSEIILDEIKSDSSPYFWPKSNKHTIFERAYMKFVNRNLNYFDLGNMMVNALLDDFECNVNFQKTLDFCKFVRKNFDDEFSPFGRMCIWYIPPKSGIKKHIDHFAYHTMITRYIFFVSNHNSQEIDIKINGDPISYCQGKLFNFFPAREYHEFINNSDSDFYFLGFDVWKKNLLDAVSKRFDLQAIKLNPLRYNSFGGELSPSKYMSIH